MHRSQFEELIDAGLASRQQHGRTARPFRTAFQSAVPLNLDAVERVSAPVRPHLSAGDLRRAYRDGATAASRPDAEVAPNEKVVLQPRPDLADLLGQLSNHKSMTRVQLHALRRQLARCLHPDLMSAEDRQSATAEMARLNALIDSALQQHSS